MVARLISTLATKVEIDVIRDLYQKQIAIFRDHPQERDTFLKTGNGRSQFRYYCPKRDEMKLQHGSFAARSLFMLNESITLY